MKMREIKFRAWDGTDWVYSECISKDGINWWILNNQVHVGFSVKRMLNSDLEKLIQPIIQR
ncbi:hypothetical protein ACT4UT_30750, partial [Bacillus sp. B-TM1]